MTQVIAVSKSGKNVLTETNPNNFIFHSLYNTFKIVSVLSASVNLTANTNNQNFNFNHNLSYIPSVYVFSKKSGSIYVYTLGTYTAEYIDGYSIEEVSADNTKVYISFNNYINSSFTVYLKIFLFESFI
jgi:hypothetical protein